MLSDFKLGATTLNGSADNEPGPDSKLQTAGAVQLPAFNAGQLDQSIGVVILLAKLVMHKLSASPFGRGLLFNHPAASNANAQLCSPRPPPLPPLGRTPWFPLDSTSARMQDGTPLTYMQRLMSMWHEPTLLFWFQRTVLTGSSKEIPKYELDPSTLWKGCQTYELLPAQSARHSSVPAGRLPISFSRSKVVGADLLLSPFGF